MSVGFRFPKIDMPPEAEALRAEVRAFLAAEVAAGAFNPRPENWMFGSAPEFSRKLGARGWIGMVWPKKYGGHERSQLERYVVTEELLAAGAPVIHHWVGDRQTGPLLLRFGREWMREELLPRIASGELSFAIGMSEPDSGSDLASVRTRADLTPEGWRVNGSKIWTTHGTRAHYMIALVRTSGKPDDRQAGLSQLLIDMRTPGVTARPIRDVSGDEHFSEVHFDNALLPADALIGEEGKGWAQVNAELAFERSGPERIYSCMALIDAWLDFVRAKGPTDGEAELAGRLLANVNALRNLSISTTARLARGESPVNEASVVKELGTTWEQSIPGLITDHLASVDGPVPGDLLAALDYTAAMSPSYSLRGGTREILRGIIARGMGLR